MSTVFERALLVDVSLGGSLGREVFGDLTLGGDPREMPDTFLTDGAQWEALRRASVGGNQAAKTAVEAIFQRGQLALQNAAESVIDKPEVPAGADPRAYRSLAKYWWPDPNTPDGTPYVRCDGDVNPQWRDPEFDAVRFLRLVDDVGALAFAEYFARTGTYGRAATARIYRWFLDPATGQRPHFESAQIRPGHEDAKRGVGLIEARHLIAVCESICLLRSADSFDSHDLEGFSVWLGELRRWMDESAAGKEAAASENNVGFWFDLQRVVYDHFLHDRDAAAAILEDSVLPRLAAGIRPDGEMPLELARADSHQYVAFTAAALLGLTRGSEQLDVDLWRSGEAEGRSVETTLTWVADQLLPGDVRRGAVQRLATALAGQPDGDVDPLDVGGSVELSVRLRLALRHAQHRGERAERLSDALDDQRAKAIELSRRLQSERAEAEQLRAAGRQADDRIRELEGSVEALRSERDRMQQDAENASRTLERVQTEAAQDREQFERKVRRANRQREAMEQSTSWRVTAPLRAIANLFLRIAALRSRVRDILSGVRTVADVVALLRKVLERVEHRLAAPSPGIEVHRDGSEQSTGSPREAVGRSGGRRGERRTDRLPSGRRRPTRLVTDDELRTAYEGSPVSQMAETFVLYRIIGNDLPPRHAPGQSRRNVAFILEHEPELDGCEKRWIVNRIADPEEEAAVLRLLEDHGQEYLRIPFDLAEYRHQPFDLEALPEPGFCFTEQYGQLGPEQQQRVEARVYRSKNLYAMHNNGGRNAALDDGAGRAKWVLPFDGNCFFHRSGWEALKQSIERTPHVPFFVVPMARLTDNQLLLRDDLEVTAEEEPQLVFRVDVEERFHDGFPYGRRPKVEMFWRLGIGGAWDRWKDDPWEVSSRPPSELAGGFAHAGWVARLASGQDALEQADKASFKNRGLARNEAILQTLVSLDARGMEATAGDDLRYFRTDTIEAFSEATTPTAQPLQEQLENAAQEALERGPFSVTDKTTLPPSEDPHDYWHPAPYWWPDPRKKDGLPYIRKDGQRVPGTVMYESESDQYDRTRLQRLFDDTTILALAGRILGEPEYHAHAARLVRTWFLDPATRMNPHLRYAQVRRGRNQDQGFSTGLIEFKDVYYFLDAVTLLARSEALSRRDVDGLHDWFSQYLDWLLTSDQGAKECRARNNHGTLYDVQVVAIAGFLGQCEEIARAERRAFERLLDQFEPDGRQPHEMTRTITAHYCAFNLQSWMNLADLLQRFGSDLWKHSSSDGRGPRRAIEWFLRASSDGEVGWSYEQIEPFDWERRFPLLVAAADVFGTRDFAPVGPDLLRPRFHPHDGIAPFWFLARSADVLAPCSEVPEVQATSDAPVRTWARVRTGGVEQRELALAPMLLVSGFAWSGSSAAVDLISEHVDVSVPPAGEVTLLEMLENFLRRKPERPKPVQALLCGQIAGKLDEAGYNHSRHSRKLRRFFEESRMPQEEFSARARAIIDPLVDLPELGKAAVSDQELIRSQVTRYVQLLHEAADAASLHLYDNLLHANRLDFLRFVAVSSLPPVGVIAVDRDPRDQFFELVHVRSRYELGDWPDFVDDFRRRRRRYTEARAFLAEDAGWRGAIRSVQFEDLVRKGSSIPGDLRRFAEDLCGGSLAAERWQLGTRFEPSESLKNVGKWRTDDDQAVYTSIASELGEWCVQE